MLQFDTPAGIIVWVEPGLVASVEVGVLFGTPKGQLMIAKIEMANGRVHNVLDPNKDAGRTIAAEKAKRTSEISLIIHALSKPRAGG